MRGQSYLLSAPRRESVSCGIDFLRGAFALWLLMAHIIPWAHYAKAEVKNNFLDTLMAVLGKTFQGAGETHPAVLGFIVLSGYCIHRSGARGSHEFNLKKYALRRFFRIYPVYLLAIIFGVTLYGFSTEISKAMATCLNGTTHISAFYILVKLTGISALVPNLHFCSFQGNAPLSTVLVEMWLYILYPIIIFSMQKGLSEKRIATSIGVIYLVFLTYTHLNPASAGWWHNGSLFSFAIYWWIGAYFVREKPLERRKLSLILGTWLCLTLALIFLNLSSLFLVEARKVLLALLFGAAIKALDDNPSRWYKPVGPIGRAGYSLYAFHAPIISYMLIATKSALLAVAASIIMSLVLYHLFENPFRKWGRHLSDSSDTGLALRQGPFRAL